MLRWVSGGGMEGGAPGGRRPEWEWGIGGGVAAPGGLATLLARQTADDTRYFDAAGFAGRTVGLDERKAASR